MSVDFSLTALDDVFAIGTQIAAFSEARAARVTRDIVQGCLALSDFPLRHPLVPAYESSGIRRRPIGDYLIFFKVFDRDVVIVHILHGATDYERILFPDG